MTVSKLSNMGKLGVAAVAVVASLSLPALVSAEGTETVSARLNVLEVQASQLSRSLEALGAGDFSLTPPVAIGQNVAQVAQSRDTAQLNLRLSQLEEQIRLLTGQVEGLTFQMTQYQTLLERMQEDIDFRFGQIDPSLGN